MRKKNVIRGLYMTRVHLMKYLTYRFKSVSKKILFVEDTLLEDRAKYNLFISDKITYTILRLEDMLSMHKMTMGLNKKRDYIEYSDFPYNIMWNIQKVHESVIIISFHLDDDYSSALTKLQMIAFTCDYLKGYGMLVHDTTRSHYSQSLFACKIRSHIFSATQVTFKIVINLLLDNKYKVNQSKVIFVHGGLVPDIREFYEFGDMYNLDIEYLYLKELEEDNTVVDAIRDAALKKEKTITVVFYYGDMDPIKYTDGIVKATQIPCIEILYNKCILGSTEELKLQYNEHGYIVPADTVKLFGLILFLLENKNQYFLH